MTADPQRTELGAALRSRRKQKGFSLRDLADEVGVSFNTLSRVERGYVPDLKNYRAIVEWLEVPYGTFLEGSERSSEPDTSAAIASHLFSDERLSESDARAIAHLVKEMYEQLAVPTPRISVHLRSAQTFRPDAGNLLAELLQDMHAALADGQDASG